jgi:hypothetical protein
MDSSGRMHEYISPPQKTQKSDDRPQTTVTLHEEMEAETLDVTAHA